MKVSNKFKMSNKTNCIDARQELAELVKRKAEIGVSTFSIIETIFFYIFAIFKI